MKSINEILTNDKFYPIKKQQVQNDFKVPGGKRYFYFFKTDAGLQYRVSIVLIPSSTNLQNFIIGKYYPEAAKFADKITKKNPKTTIATLTFAVYLEDYSDYEDKTLTNQGMVEYVKILQTCIKLLKDFIQEHNDVKVLYFSGAFKADEKADRLANVSQRTSIMKSLIQRFIVPGWKTKQYSNLILLYKS